MSASTRWGIFFAVAANTIWGVFPIYWSLLRGTPAAELVGHRVVWAFVFSLLVAVFRFQRGSRDYRQSLLAALRQRQTWVTYGMAGGLIAINWLAFLWAVTHDRVLLSSLGYYINPLLNVLLGVVVLGEHLSRSRWFAIGLAAIGVLVMTYAAGEVPWVSLAMATSFAGYALIKKRARLDAMNGLVLETSVLVVPTLIYLAWIYQSGGGDFGKGDVNKDWLLILGGLFTLVPLALFSAATQRAPLSLIGVLQYVGPTLQFIVGVFYFGEPLSSATLVGFSFVWTGVAVFLLARR
ncbi:EamA family transporter RarD [Stieleria sp. TO1_6]|uniref:EamA family transporter RarD n=1 Tax=Stieleria tagensis TaxID=2956795 RepID=UPI00209A9F53|nr:EamA family transporter RarD [Stieleria tagensis]MCO8120736.1 EamA family transporter RarD [Stieleria tagensis]